MSVKVENYGNVAVLTLKEDLAGDYAQVFTENARLVNKEGRHEVVVDCSEIDAFDSLGLEALLDLQAKCEEELGAVKLCGLSQTCGKILEVTRLARRFEMYADLEGAVRSFA